MTITELYDYVNDQLASVGLFILRQPDQYDDPGAYFFSVYRRDANDDQLLGEIRLGSMTREHHFFVQGTAVGSVRTTCPPPIYTGDGGGYVAIRMLIELVTDVVADYAMNSLELPKGL